MSEDLDCRSCGACCVVDHDYGHYAQLEERDVERLRRAGKLLRLAKITNQVLPVMVYDEEYWAMRTKQGRQGSWGLITCKAFKGKVGGKCECSIYGIRPRICRDFRKGSADCKEAREQCQALLPVQQVAP